jgi:hypothetical protein
MGKQVLKRFTMDVDHTNPDAKTIFTSVGTGKTEKEAVVFALSMFYKVMDGDEEGSPSTQNYEDALEIVSEKLEEEGIDEIVRLLREGKIEKNSEIFYNSYESTNVDYKFSEISEVSECGYIGRMEIIEPEY